MRHLVTIAKLLDNQDIQSYQHVTTYINDEGGLLPCVTLIARFDFEVFHNAGSSFLLPLRIFYLPRV